MPNTKDTSMPTLHLHTPCPILKPYIHQMWLAQGYHPAHHQERILPHGSMELLFDLTEQAITLRYLRDGYQAHHFNEPVLSGGFSHFFVVDTHRPGDYLSVWFKAGAAQLFFGIPAQELHNRHWPLSLLWGGSAFDLYHQVLAAPSLLARFAVLEAALVARLGQVDQPRHPAVSFALSAFQQVPHPFTISQITQQLSLSPTRFIEVFRQSVGISPKRYGRVVRFQAALRQIARAKSLNWASLAVECGYFDQAHLINEFQALAGLSPTQYRPSDPDHHSNIAF
jgi:AraC-like DNA-binding protein